MCVISGVFCSFVCFALLWRICDLQITNLQITKLSFDFCIKKLDVKDFFKFLIKTMNVPLNRHHDPRGCVWLYEVLNSLRLNTLLDSVGWSLYQFLFCCCDKPKQLKSGSVYLNVRNSSSYQGRESSRPPEQEANWSYFYSQGRSKEQTRSGVRR